MRSYVWGLAVIALGFAGIILGSGNVLVLALSGLLILFGILVIAIAAFARWLLSTLFRTPKTYGRLVATQQGETVRSNSERMIADYFSQNGIKYVYERPANLRGRYRRTVHPDFFLPDYRVYVEFWGLLDADDPRLRSRYEQTMKWKMSQYHRNNIKFISIYPNNLNNLDLIFRAKFREVIGFDLPKGTNIASIKYCSNCGTPINPDARFCKSCGKRLA